MTTEERLKEAARNEFMQKGFAATKTRDIAKAAGTNLALLNYYFRSKEKLFEIVMSENIDQLFSLILPVLSDMETSLAQKLNLISNHYTTILLAEPNLPIFVLSEIQNHPERFGNQIKLNTAIMQSTYIAQLGEADKETDPVQHFITYLGILLFPFIMKPVMKATGVINNEAFVENVQKRQEMAPMWMMRILKLG